MSRLRVAIVADYPEEGWPSMDLVAAMLLDQIGRNHAGEIEATRVVPAYRPRLGRLPTRRGAGLRRNVDRLLNRFVDYPRYLRRLSAGNPFDVYHVVDHSYAQLVRALPKGRTVVTCHDLDTFRCVLEPGEEPRPPWFRAMVRRTLSGLREAAAVPCDSEATRAEILAHALVPADRLEVVHLGAPPDYFDGPSPEGEAEADRLVGPADPSGPPILLHVGSNIPRKRIDVLLGVFDGVRRAIPGARLVKVGGAISADEAGASSGLGVLEAVEAMPRGLPAGTVAALYRRSALVLQPSQAEGFGLPIAEAMASGAQVLASDLAVLREVGGGAVVYRAVGGVAAWVAAALAMIGERARDLDAYRARVEAGKARASRFRWDRHADAIAATYRRVAGRA